MHDYYYTVKKVTDFPVPSRDVTTKLSLAVNNLLFPASKSLVMTSRLGRRKTITFFAV
jgi:hypothetical protein